MTNSPQRGLIRDGVFPAVGLRPAARRISLSLAGIISLVALFLLQGQLAWGQDDWDVDSRPAQQPAAQVGGFMVAERDFDQWVFGGMNREQVKERFESQLAMQVDACVTACGLSDAQKRKLELAGRADIKAFFQTVEQLREKYRDVGQDQQKLQQMWQEIAPLQQESQSGFFEDTSFLNKAFKRTLDDQQSALYETQQRDRQKFRYEAKVELVVTMLEARMPLRAEQRERLIKLLLDETKPPKKFCQQDYYVVLYQAGKIDEAKLKPIFDDGQWKAFKQALDQTRQMEPFLKANGFLP